MLNEINTFLKLMSIYLIPTNVEDFIVLKTLSKMVTLFALSPSLFMCSGYSKKESLSTGLLVSFAFAGALMAG